MLHNNQSMDNTIDEIFKIDKLGKGIAVKILFAFLVMLRIYVNVFPFGSTDFDNFFGYLSDILEDPDLFWNASLSDIPLSKGNIIFVASILMADFISICGYYVYVGIMIRFMRKGNEKYQPISAGALLFRLSILFMVTFLLFLPGTILLLYLSIFFIIIFPWLFMYPACYLSGDSGFFMSFAEIFRKNKGYYFVNIRNLAVIMLVSLFLQMISSLVGYIYEPVVIVIDTFIYVFTLFCVARYSCLIYRRMILLPMRSKGPVDQSN